MDSDQISILYLLVTTTYYVVLFGAAYFLSSKSRYSVIKKAGRMIAFVGLLLYFAGFLLPILTYKLFLFAAGMFMARFYWRLSDGGWFSVPLYFLQISLLWALYYFITVNPDPGIFAVIFNRFADLAPFFVIGCSVYRIRALKKRENMTRRERELLKTTKLNPLALDDEAIEEPPNPLDEDGLPHYW